MSKWSPGDVENSRSQSTLQASPSQNKTWRVGMLQVAMLRPSMEAKPLSRLDA